MATNRELAEVLGDFARTMVTDFPIQAILDRLVQRIVEIMPISAAGVTLIDDGLVPRYVAASDGSALRYEQLQTELGDGPCLAAYRGGAAVAIPDLRADTRFEAFGARARAEGLAAVWTFPLRQGDRRLGALDLYRDTPGPLDAEEMATAQTLADVTAAYLVNAQTRADLEDSSAASQHRALHDALTGLPNRMLLLERLDHVLRSSGRSNRMVTVIYVDLDRFKSVNDDHGHGVGDKLLKAVATRLTALLRPGDTLARMSGDEFVVVCEDLDEERQAEMIAARMVTSLAVPFTVGGVQVAISASAGIAFAGPGSSLLPERVLHEADAAMYQAKRQGGHRHQIIDLRAGQDDQDHDGLSGALAGAARRDELRLDYQPIVSTLDGHLVGAEALVRWDHPTRGLIPPAVVVPLAETSGVMPEVGCWVLETACAALTRWHRLPAGGDLGMSVNVSALQLMDPQFVATVASVLERTLVDPRRLTLEITEAVLLEDSSRAAAVLAEVKGLGVRIALDDFGTGYSPLTYLRAFPVDVVKIDQGFVATLLHDPPSHAIVTKVIELAHLLDITVVSEGVETIEQHQALTTLGSEYCQGYYFSRPMTSAAFGDLLERPGPPAIHFPTD